MLISRVAALALQERATSASRNVAERSGSIGNLWLLKQRDIEDAFRDKQFVTDFECNLLNSSESGWIKSWVVFLKDGVLQFYVHSRRQQNLVSINLLNSVVVGHIRECLVQISTNDQIVLFSVSEELFAPVCASLFSWSQLRPAGIAAKLWVPPIPRMETADKRPLLRCSVRAQFTEYHPEIVGWHTYSAYLSPLGQFALMNDANDVVYRLQLATIRSNQIKMMDPSVVGPCRVIMLFPDYGGPNTVYVKFDDAADYADWVATMKVFSQQVVAAPLSRDSLECVRWYETLEVKIGSCERDPEYRTAGAGSAGAGSASGSAAATGAGAARSAEPSLADTYVEICLRRWTFARTIENVDRDVANFSQTFELSDPEFDPSGFGTIELKLRRAQRDQQRAETGPGVTLGSIELTEWDSQGNWDWLHVEDTPWRLAVSVNPGRIPVLDYTYYKELQKKFEDIPLRVASRLLQAYPSLLASLFPVYMKIYRAQGYQLDWILDLATQEIDKMDFDSDVLFRGTSLFTKSLELLLQQFGSQVLEKTVGRFIRKLAAIAKPVELDPARLSAETDLKRNQLTMDYYLQYLWPIVRNEGVPAEAKAVFRHMTNQLRQRDLPEDRVAKIMSRTLAAFLFLRFYCPALLNPQLFNLVSQNLDKEQRRTLVLVAKILQGFANRVKFGSKETWLIPMNDFIEKNEDELLRWYQKIYDSESPPATAPATATENDAQTDAVSSAASSVSAGIRRVASPVHVSEPPPKELPVDAFMDQQLTSPNLVDEWATYAQLANIIVDFRAKQDQPDAEDAVVRDILQECRFIVDKQESIKRFLEEPDMYEDSYSGPTPSLCFNKETSLFGLNPEHLEFEPEVRKTSSFSESLARIGRLPRTTVDEAKQKSGSMRKLMGKFGISR